MSIQFNVVVNSSSFNFTKKKKFCILPETFDMKQKLNTKEEKNLHCLSRQLLEKSYTQRKQSYNIII